MFFSSRKNVLTALALATLAIAPPAASSAQTTASPTTVIGTMANIKSLQTHVVSGATKATITYVKPGRLLVAVPAYKLDILVVNGKAWQRMAKPVGAWTALSPAIAGQITPLLAPLLALQASPSDYSTATVTVTGSKPWRGKKAHQYTIPLGAGTLAVTATDADHYWRTASMPGATPTTLTFSNFNAAHIRSALPKNVAGTPLGMSAQKTSANFTI